MYHKSRSYDVWFLRYEVQQAEFFCHLGPFFALLPPSNSSKNENIKNEKTLRDTSFYTSVLKIMIIGYTVDMKRDRCNCYFYFEQYNSLLPPYSSKIENFKTMKKRPADIIILHTCTKNHYHMLYYF